MSQPIPTDHNRSSEPDPLLAFAAEPESAPAPALPTASANPAEPVVNAAHPAPRETAAVSADEHAELRRRVERAERLIEKALIEASAVKSDLATLVSAVDDIKRRQSRRDDAPPEPPATMAKRLSRAVTAAAAVLIVMLGFLVWGFLSLASDDIAEPLPIQSEAAGPVADTPVSVAAVPPAPVEIQKTAAVSTVLPARDVASREPTARVAPATRQPSRTAAAAGYVGTLTIDAEPGGDVFINRKNVGRTPLRLDNLRAGSHLVWIERDGYRRWTRVVAVAANRISRVSAELDPVSR